MTSEFVGKTVSKYRILEEVGRGGMGLVYKALDTRTNTTVAIKALPPELTHSPSLVRRFQQEAQALSSLQHPNIVRLIKTFEEKDTHCIVMEYVEGQTLSHILQKGPLPTEKAKVIALQICAALSHAHQQGIIHRDIKPSNIMITPDGGVKVTDFGIARVIDSTLGTITGATMGTAEYMSPEQVRGEKADGRSDIYSLGVVLYQMLTGRVPFTSDNRFAIGYMHLHQEPVPPRKVNPKMPEGIEGIVLHALEKRKERRYQAAAEVARDLQEGFLSPEERARAKGILKAEAESVARRRAIARPLPPSKVGLRRLSVPVMAIAGLMLVLLVVVARVATVVPSASTSELTGTEIRVTTTPAPTKTSTPEPPATATTELNGKPSPQGIEIRASCYPGRTITDPAFDVSIAHIDTTAFSSTLDGETLQATFHIRDVPSQLTFHRVGVSRNAIEYQWEVLVDIDNNPQTGCTGIGYKDAPSGWEYSLNTHHVAIQTDSPVIQPIEYEVDTDTWECQPPTRWISRGNAMLDLDPQSDTITLTGDIPGITSASRLFFLTYDYNPEGDQQWDESSCGAEPTASPVAPQGHIAFISHRDGEREIYKMTADGSEVTRLTYNGAIGDFLSWSPDGNWIAFDSFRDDNPEIYKMRADGSEVTRLTFNEATDGFPAWSPDGQWIAFVSDREGNDEIYEMRADGSEVTRLTFNEATDWCPTWSPDGQWIAFESDRGENWHIYKMKADGSELTCLTPDKERDVLPSWSPDAEWIAFRSDRDGKSDIYRMRADGSEVTRLTFNELYIGAQTWSPDGQWIAFESDRGWGGNLDIYKMRADGSEVTRLSYDEAYDGDPSWGP